MRVSGDVVRGLIWVRPWGFPARPTTLGRPTSWPMRCAPGRASAPSTSVTILTASPCGSRSTPACRFRAWSGTGRAGRATRCASTPALGQRPGVHQRRAEAVGPAATTPPLRISPWMPSWPRARIGRLNYSIRTSALRFLYRQVLRIDEPWLTDIASAGQAFASGVDSGRGAGGVGADTG